MDDQEHRPSLPTDVCWLFADGGAGRTLSTALPPGSVVWPDPSHLQHQWAAAGPAFWLSEAPVTGELWQRLRAEHGASGLWPILLEDSMQPWSAGQIAPEPVTEIERYDAAEFMAEVWADWVELQPGKSGDFEELAPFGRECPGLAAPGDLVADPDTVADWFASILGDGTTPLGLAPVRRGADALAVMGWEGAVNHNQCAAPLAAVVRSWEDRFGARIVRMGYNTLDLSVAAPPVTAEHAQHVAAEHWAFCPDCISQGTGMLADHAEDIRGTYSWSFWWD